MQTSKVFPAQRERHQLDFEFKIDREELRAVMSQCSAGNDCDYKDAIASLSSQLEGRVRGTKLYKQARKLGLLDGYNCPRHTLKCWAAV